MTQSETLNKLYQENGLSKDDVFSNGQYKIITRAGIEKIQYKNNITVKYEVVRCEEQFAVIKAYGIKGDKVIETFGEYNLTHIKTKKDGTVIQNYPVAIAEKRALSRVVLKLSNLYEHGFFGEDEEIPQEDIPKPPRSNEEKNADDAVKERQRKIDHINKSKSLTTLARVKEHIGDDWELLSMYSQKLKELSK